MLRGIPTAFGRHFGGSFPYLLFGRGHAVARDGSRVMAIEFTLSGDYTLDESGGLQTGADGTPSGTPRADSDVAVASLPATFSTYLFTTLGLSNSFPSSVGAAASASNLINVTSDANLATLGLTDSNGDAFDGDATSLFTTDGDQIYLWSDLNNQVVLGKTSGGDVVFAIYMEPDGALDTDVNVKLWTVTFEAIDHPVEGSTTAAYDDAVDLLSLVYLTATGSKTFNFDALPSGQNLFGIVGDVEDAIVIIGERPVLNADGTYVTGGSNSSDTINTSKGGGPTTIGIDNQQFNPIGGGTDVNDGCFFTYVEDPDPRYLAGVAGGLNQNEADDADNIQFGNTKEVNDAFLKIVQVVGNGTASLSVTAYNLSDNSLDGKAFVEDGMGAEGGTKANITSASVYIGSIDPLNLVETSTGAIDDSKSEDVTISIVDGVASYSGLSPDMIVVWHTDSVHDQALVQTNTGSAAYDIGLFGLLEGEKESVSLAGRGFVEDDGPAIGDIANSTVQFTSGASSGPVALLDIPGTDGQGTLQITDYTASFSILGKTIEGHANAAGTEVKYFEDLNNNDILDGNDVHWYTLSITQNALGADYYDFDVINAPAAPPLEFDFAGLPSGQNLFGMVADAGAPDGPGAVFSSNTALIKNPGNGEMAKGSGTINTSQGGGPTTIGSNNQMIDPGEGIYFTIVNNPVDAYLANVSGGLNQNEADDADFMQFASLRDVTGSFMRVSQTQGNEAEACTIEVFNITDNATQGRALLTAAKSHVDITYAAVYVGSVDPLNLLEDTAGFKVDPNIEISISDGIVSVSGLEANYIVVWETDGVDRFDQALITGTAGKFDIGGFGLSEPQVTPDHPLNFEVTLTDGDGDTALDTFTVNIDAVPFI